MSEPAAASPPSAPDPAALVRLLVKDPEWLFVYWELPDDPRAELRARAGDRSASLARLSLRVLEGPTSRDVILRSGTTSYYLEVERPATPVAVTLGWMLPSGRFEPIATSDPVTPPRSEPVSSLARVRVSFPAQRDQAARRHAKQQRQPLRAVAVSRRMGTPGASDAFAHRGASDAFRPPGASDAFHPSGEPHR